MQKSKIEIKNKIICIAILIIILFEFIIPCLSFADTRTLTDSIVSKYPEYNDNIEEFWNDAEYDLDGWTGSRDEDEIIVIDNEIIAPIKTLALNGDTSEYEQTSGDSSGYSETSGNAIETVDVFTGMILEPLLEFIRFVTDSIMGIITKFMTGAESFESVMQDEIVNNDTENVGATVTIDMEDYKNIFNNYIDYKFPNFKYSPEEIFTGKIDLLSIDFISGKIVDENGTRENASSDWNEIRTTIASWYRALRLFAMVGLLSVLIYIGIRIIISANSQDKAKYKEKLVSWFIAMVLLFSMHYIMAFIIAVVQNITTLLGDTMGVIRVNLDGTNETFTTNLIGLARFQAQQMALSKQIEYIIIYVALVTFTIKFTFTYLRRVLNMAFLTLIAPIVALMYPIDKMNGEAKSFQLWLKDYVYNALLQPMHYIVYMILINSALSLAANNPIYAIVALLFMTQAEKLLKRIFGFQKAGLGTVGGIAGAYATGSVVGGIIGMFRKPPILAGGSSGNNSKEENNNNSSDWIDDYYGPTLDDTGIENFYDSFENAQQSLFPSGSGGVFNNSQNRLGPSMNLGEAQNYIFNFRNNISGETLKNFRNKKDIDFNSFFDMIKNQLGMLKGLSSFGQSESKQSEIKSTISSYKSWLRQGIALNESEFRKLNIPFQYNDIYANVSTNDLLSKMIMNMEEGNFTKAEEYRDIINQRIQQNRYITENGGPQFIINSERSRENGENLYGDSQGLNTGTDNSIPGVNPQNPNLIVGENYGKSVQNQEHRTNQQKLNELSDTNTENGIQNQNPETSYQDSNESAQTQKPNLENSSSRPIFGGDLFGFKRTKAKRYMRRANSNQMSRLNSQAQNVLNSRVANGLKNVGKNIVKPVWDTDKKKYNGKNVMEKAAKLAAGVALGTAAAAVQAGISITDGKYSPMEGIASFGAGMAGGNVLINNAKEFGKDVRKNILSKDEEKLIEKRGDEWYNRDDVIAKYKNTYGSKAKEMRQRARDNYVRRGVTDPKDQELVFKYADHLLAEGKVSSQDEADRLAVATFQYKQNLLDYGNYDILFDNKKKEQYLNFQEKTSSSSASGQTVRRTHEAFIKNVLDFDRITEN